MNVFLLYVFKQENTRFYNEEHFLRDIVMMQ